MAKTSFQLIPEEMSLLYARTMVSGDRYVVPRVRRKVLFLSRKRKKGLTLKSLIPIITPVWNGLEQGERDDWNEAGVETNLSGFKLFLRDRSFRLKNDLEGYATPNKIYQTLVGKMKVEEPATGFRIKQLHPFSYWVSRKVRGTKDKYQPILIKESFGLPLKIEVSTKSDLTSLGEGSFARFYAVVYSHYQGRLLENICKIEIPLSSSWARREARISRVIGLTRGYTVFCEIYNARGSLYFDNVAIEHSGQNWARDPACNTIASTFTKAFFQVPRHWAAVELPEGAFYQSLYYT